MSQRLRFPLYSTAQSLVSKELGAVCPQHALMPPTRAVLSRGCAASVFFSSLLSKGCWKGLRNESPLSYARLSSYLSVLFKLIFKVPVGLERRLWLRACCSSRGPGFSLSTHMSSVTPVSWAPISSSDLCVC